MTNPIQEVSQNRMGIGSQGYFQGILDELENLAQDYDSQNDDEKKARAFRFYTLHTYLDDASNTDAIAFYGDVRDDFDALKDLTTQIALYGFGTDQERLDAVDNLSYSGFQGASALVAAVQALQAQMAADIKDRVSTQDLVLFEYSQAGAADLNDQLGQLGDALDGLNRLITSLNRVDRVFSINPEKEFINDRGEVVLKKGSSVAGSYTDSEGTQLGGGAPVAPLGPATGDRNYFYNYTSEWTNTSGGKNAIEVMQDAVRELETLAEIFPDGETNSSINKVLTRLGRSTSSNADQSYNILSWDPNDPYRWADTQGADIDSGFYWSQTATFNTSAPYGDPNNPGPGSANDIRNLARVWMDPTLRADVAEALASAQSQNDIQKQNLRKAMFIYQEFIKSAGSVMDRIFEATKNIASRIGR